MNNDSDEQQMPSAGGVAVQDAPASTDLEVELTPSVMDLIDKGELWDATDLLEQSYRADPEHFRDYWRLYSDAVRDDIGPDGGLSALVRMLQGYRSGEQVKVDTSIPCFELHCPHLFGCRVEGTIATERSTECNFTLTIADRNLFSRYRASGRISKVTRSVEAACYCFRVPATLLLREWSVPDNPHARPIYSLAAIDYPLGITHFSKDPELCERHLCEETEGPLARFRSAHWVSVGGGEAMGDDEPIKGETELTASTGLEFTLPLQYAGYSIELAVRTRIRNSFSLAWRLAGNADYHGFVRMAGKSPVFWHWLTATPRADK